MIFKEKNSLGEQAKPNLVKVVKLLLSLPYSNAAVERVFTQLKLIKTDHRANLKHESLLALLTTKMTILKSSSSESNSCKTVKLDCTKGMLSLHHAMKSNADDVTTMRKEFIKKLKTDYYKKQAVITYYVVMQEYFASYFFTVIQGVSKKG